MRSICFVLVLYLLPQVLIAESPSKLSLLQTIEIALTNNYQIQIQRETINISQSQLEFARSEFDTVFSPTYQERLFYVPFNEAERLLYGIPTDRQHFSIYNVDFSKKLSQGIILRPSLTMTRLHTLSFIGNPPTNSGLLSFTAIIPFLKGAGEFVTLADERAAWQDYQASILAFQFNASSTMRDVVIAYWNYVASENILKVRKAAEERAEELVKATKGLIEAEEYAAIDLQQPLAHLAVAISNRYEAEKLLFQSRQRLAIAMGIPFDEFDNIVLPSADTFPNSPQNITKYLSYLPGYLQDALADRTDLQAAQKEELSSRILFYKAKDNLKPSLNVELSTGYSSLEEGGKPRKVVTGLTRNIGGINASAIVSFNLPFGLRAEKAEVQRTRAIYQQNALATQELGITIQSEVSQELVNLIKNAQEVEESIKATKALDLAVSGEFTKFKAGLSTVFNLVILEDLRNTELIAHISNQLDYSTSLVRLLHATGSLIEFNGQTFMINVEDFFKILQPSGCTSTQQAVKK